MDKGYENEKFAGLRIKESVAKRFRRYSRQLGGSQSMALLRMMDFFEVNGLSPDDRLQGSVHSLKSLIKRRIGAVIAIVRDIEKNQTKPTNAMLGQLFEQASRDTEEDHGLDLPAPVGESKELEHYRSAHHELRERLVHTRKWALYLMDHIHYVKKPFGNGQYRLDMEPGEYEELKKRFDHVHHHHTTEAGQQLPAERQ